MEMKSTQIENDCKQSRSEGAHSSADGGFSFNFQSGTSESAERKFLQYDESREYTPSEVLEWETEMYTAEDLEIKQESKTNNDINTDEETKSTNDTKSK